MILTRLVSAILLATAGTVTAEDRQGNQYKNGNYYNQYAGGAYGNVEDDKYDAVYDMQNEAASDYIQYWTEYAILPKRCVM